MPNTDTHPRPTATANQPHRVGVGVGRQHSSICRAWVDALLYPRIQPDSGHRLDRVHVHPARRSTTHPPTRPTPPAMHRLPAWMSSNSPPLPREPRRETLCACGREAARPPFRGCERCDMHGLPGPATTRHASWALAAATHSWPLMSTLLKANDRRLSK